ncbi:MAG: hypothetical protein J6Q51_04910, partial [Clostridia bacterium]|nr:hypothetical protein [Clostridia bacterium]
IGTNNDKFTSATKVYNYLGESGWELVEIITPATCTTTGVGKFTNFWGDTKQDTIPASHTSMVDGKCTKCGVSIYNYVAIYGSFGFERNDEGKYVSNNKYIDSSMAIARLTAVANTTITIRFSVDTEKHYDKFKIALNGTVLDLANEVSGVYSGEVTISLSAGDIVVFTYTKDGSGSSVSDYVQFEIC